MEEVLIPIVLFMVIGLRLFTIFVTLKRKNYLKIYLWDL